MLLFVAVDAPVRSIYIRVKRVGVVCQHKGFIYLPKCACERKLSHLQQFVAVCLCISSSQLDCLDLVVDFEVKRVEVADEGVFHEWAVGGHIVLLSRFEICVKLVPFLVEIVTF